jgi:hypothetical protein
MRSAECKTYSMAEVARLLGIGRNQAYEAAKRGDFETITIGVRTFALKIPLDRKLEGGGAAGEAA